MAKLKKDELSVKKLLKLYKQGNMIARDIIIKRYIKYVDEAVEKYKGFYLSEEDLYQSAFEGLLIAIENCKPESTNPFTYEVKSTIDSNILSEIKNHIGMNDLPNTVVDLMKKIEDCKESLEKDLERTPHTEEIIEELNLNAQLIKEAIVNAELIQSINPRSFEGFITPLEQSTTRVTEQEAILREMKDVLNREIKERLTYKEAYIIILKYIKELDLTNEIIGKMLDITGSYVSAIESKALKKLKIFTHRALTGYIEEAEETRNSKNQIYRLQK